jgi:hypothetical protein
MDQIRDKETLEGGGGRERESLVYSSAAKAHMSRKQDSSLSIY